MGLGGFLKGLVKPIASVGASLIPGGSLIKDGIMGAAGAALAGNSAASANNRGAQIEADLAQQRLRQDANSHYDDATLRRGELVENQKQRLFDQMLAREKDGRESGKDAFRGMQQAAYVAGGGASGAPSKFGFGPKGASADEMANAAAFKAELSNRLQNGNQMMMPEGAETIAAIERPDPYTIDPSLLKPGGMEKWGGMVGTGLTMFDAMRRQGQPAPVMNTTVGRVQYPQAPGPQTSLFRPHLEDMGN